MDIPRAITVDDSGNVYVTEFAHEYVYIGDYVTIKYNSEGVEQWIVHYDSPDNAADYTEDIAVDRYGKVYITGQGGISCATVKYDASRAEQWAARYEGPLFHAGGTKIVLDPWGNVLVSGFSNPSENYSLLDYLTLKYNASGEEQWVHSHSNQDSTCDLLQTMGVDGSGSVAVTGWSLDPDNSSNWDCSAVRIDASGNEQWVNRYDGPRHTYAGANAVAVDQSGKSVVTGGCYCSDSSTDLMTIQYSASGEELWTAFYPNGWAKDVAVDESGNVYVTGTGTGPGSQTFDFITIKYGPDGTNIPFLCRYSIHKGNHHEPVIFSAGMLPVYCGGRFWTILVVYDLYESRHSGRPSGLHADPDRLRLLHNRFLVRHHTDHLSFDRPRALGGPLPAGEQQLASFRYNADKRMLGRPSGFLWRPILAFLRTFRNHVFRDSRCTGRPLGPPCGHELSSRCPRPRYGQFHLRR